MLNYNNETRAYARMSQKYLIVIAHDKMKLIFS